MIDLLITGAQIVTVNKKREIIYNGAMAVDKNRIIDIGDSASIEEKYGDVALKIDARGKVVFPGFINTHIHLMFSSTLGYPYLYSSLS